MSRRVTPPDNQSSTDPGQALQQFVTPSPWDDQQVLRRYRAQLAQTFASPDGIFGIDDTTFPKQGTSSVGVQRQNCGAKGKKANCQAAVSVHYVVPRGHYPLALRLFLPDSWLADRKRRDRAGVPDAFQPARIKGQSALDLLDHVRADGLPGRVVVADAWYGASGPFRQGLSDRGLSYIVGVTDELVVFPERPTRERPAGRTGGRPQTNAQLAAGSAPPVRLRDLAVRTPLRRTWRGGTKGPMAGRFAWLRV